MPKNVYNFRRMKWADPRPKLKVLAEDLKRKSWMERLSSLSFAVLVLSLATLVFMTSVVITHLLIRFLS
ncbi:hypothetical protein HW571_22565 [Agrobacterium genomosp. 3]|uniref:hypothetical protein n=1 Tax=Agrobacterium tomkonis TaxID=1183410 RepID=UPI001CD8EDA7|nr:hypothetical protein [Agrobacterium tomkonis]MCA1878894.1 hypothetical protein [Agrobacterium tumefaciens]MCA1894113.1 hypothetical protein [Agrobacterium tomkonis]